MAVSGTNAGQPLLPGNNTPVSNTLSQGFFPTCKKIAIVFAKFVAGVVLSAVGLGITFIGAKIAGFALAGTIALLAVYSLAILIATVSYRYLNNKNDKSWSTAFLKGAGFLGVIALAILCGAETGGAGDLNLPGALAPQADQSARPKTTPATPPEEERPIFTPKFNKSTEKKANN